jgi:hypothetical protein
MDKKYQVRVVYVLPGPPLKKTMIGAEPQPRIN